MEYEVGDTITYRDSGGDTRTGVVAEKTDDIKNGRPGFDLTDAGGAPTWGYDDQVISVQPGRATVHEATP